MKIAVTTRLLNGRLEGIGHHTFELLNRLIASYPAIEWHLINDGRKNQVLFAHSNIVYHVCSPPTRHPLLWYYWYEWVLPKLFSHIQPDVVWYPDGMMSLKANIPSLLTIHDLAYLHFPKGTIFSHRKYLQWLMPRQLQRANHIACVSDFTLQDVKKSFSISTDKLSIVYNAANEEFQPQNLINQHNFKAQYTDNKPYFLYLGSLHPRKNIARLIEAYDLFRSKNKNGPKLVLAGRMAWKSKTIQQAIQNADSRNDIIRLSQIDDIIHPLVASAHALVYVSLWEGFGMPVLEAMQSGVSVITSKDSAMEEIAGANAIYVDSYNIESIEHGMQNSTIQSEEQKNNIRQGIKRAEDFNWADSAEQVAKALLPLRQ